MIRRIVELIIVLCIVLIIVAIALPGYINSDVREGYIYRQKDMRAIARAMEAYRAAWGAYPASEKDSPLAGHGTGIEIDQRLLTTPVTYLPKLMNDGFREKAGKKNRTGAGAGYRIYAVGPNWMTWSIGPDLANNTDGYKSRKMLEANEALAHPAAFAGLRYDPTNGIVSPGDIYQFGGDEEKARMENRLRR